MKLASWSALRLASLLLIYGLMGGISGAFVYSTWLDGSNDTRGVLVRMPGLESYRELNTTPFCVSLHKFCLVRLQSGEVLAVYTYDTHALSRAQGCEVPWLSDFLFRDPASNEETRGWFRASCSGTTFRYDGTRVFGPGPRNMDRFPVEEKIEQVNVPDGDSMEVRYLEVDTGRLICGDAVPGAPQQCQRAPAPQ